MFPQLREDAAAGQRTGWWGVYMSLSSRGGGWLAGEGDTVVLFSQGGAGENDIRLDCFFEG